MIGLIRDASHNNTKNESGDTQKYLTSGKMKQCIGDDLGLSQPSIRKVIK